MLGTSQLIRADARRLPLADHTVDLVVTSPPYWSLRAYQDGGQTYAGQVGAEATPEEFIDALLAATREMVRVLKPAGSIWVNLGDKYSTGDPIPKTLLGIPWRYALRCIDDLGLILRAEVIWSKPNGMPESVTDRVTRKHEQWFHFTREPRYFSAVDEIREPHKVPQTAEQMARSLRGKKNGVRHGGNLGSARTNGAGELTADDLADVTGSNPLGKLPGSVWTIAPEPLTVPDHLGIQHFAAFPTEWPRRIILGWSPTGICTACDEGRRPVRGRPCTECGSLIPTQGKQCPACGFRNTAWQEQRHTNATTRAGESNTAGALVARKNGPYTSRIYVDGETCRCADSGAPTRPAVVLDPFCGTGTTVAVAKALGRHGIGTDLSADYLRLADWRTNGDGYIRVHTKVHGKVHRTAPPDPNALRLFTT